MRKPLKKQLKYMMIDGINHRLVELKTYSNNVFVSVFFNHQRVGWGKGAPWSYGDMTIIL